MSGGIREYTNCSCSGEDSFTLPVLLIMVLRSLLEMYASVMDCERHRVYHRKGKSCSGEITLMTSNRYLVRMDATMISNYHGDMVFLRRFPKEYSIWRNLIPPNLHISEAFTR